MSIKQHFTNEQARKFGDEFGFDWERGCTSVEQLSSESDIDLERGLSFMGSYTRPKAKGRHSYSTVEMHSLVSPRLPIRPKLRKDRTE